MKVTGAAGEPGDLRRGLFIPSYKGTNTLERFLLRGVIDKVRGQGLSSRARREQEKQTDLVRLPTKRVLKRA